MKLQNLAIIFSIIVIPITLVLGSYVSMQIDTIKLQISYDEKLSDAVYDAIKAYQINTANNPYSIINSSQRRDVEAAINTFMNSFATGLGVSGYGENYIKPYVPAILCALYDGYYIYAPTFNTASKESEDSEKIEHLIKPYVTYSQHYKNSYVDVVINYTLDNYITVTGIIEGEYYNKSGYLINEGIYLEEETLEENLMFDDGSQGIFPYIYIGGEKRYWDENSTSGKNWFIYREGTKVYINLDTALSKNDINAKTYSDDARVFMDWVKTHLDTITLDDLKLDDDVRERNKNDIYMGIDGTEKIFDPDENDFESEQSIFNIHKRDMIKVSIKENLSSAIANYSAHSEALNTNYAFQMPILEETEWDQITKNICMVAFVQGLPVGFKTYNNYAIINNTRNKNYVDQDSLCFINSDTSTYHKIDCPKLGETNIQGYRQIDFEETSVDVGTEIKYYYKHANLPCYYCIVARNYDRVSITEARLDALRHALARERQMLHY